MYVGKINLEAGDTTAIVNGQGYRTAGPSFTPTSVSVYDTTTRWNNVGRLLFTVMLLLQIGIYRLKELCKKLFILFLLILKKYKNYY